MKKYPKIRRPKTWLKAIDKILEAYESNKRIEECPLCLLAEDIDDYNSLDDDYSKRRYCAFCPWILFEGKECTDDLPGFRRSTFSERIKRLSRWKRIIKKQIK